MAIITLISKITVTTTFPSTFSKLIRQLTVSTVPVAITRPHTFENLEPLFICMTPAKHKSVVRPHKPLLSQIELERIFPTPCCSLNKFSLINTFTPYTCHLHSTTISLPQSCTDFFPSFTHHIPTHHVALPISQRNASHVLEFTSPAPFQNLLRYVDYFRSVMITTSHTTSHCTSFILIKQINMCTSNYKYFFFDFSEILTLLLIRNLKTVVFVTNKFQKLIAIATYLNLSPPHNIIDSNMPRRCWTSKHLTHPSRKRWSMRRIQSQQNHWSSHNGSLFFHQVITMWYPNAKKFLTMSITQL